MKDLTIRPAELADLPTLYEFEQGIITAERPFDPTLKKDPINYYDLEGLMKSEKAEVLVAVVEDNLVGSGYIQIRKAKPYLQHEDYGYVGFMFLKPDYRRKGIIQQITQQLLSWAKTKHLKEARLDVYDDNSAAIRAYEKSGFKKHLVEMRIGI